MNGIRIGRVFGIKVVIHPSWFLALGLFTFSLATAYFPLVYGAWSPVVAWLVATAATLLLFGSVLAHELGHSLVARAQGIPVEHISLFILGGVSTFEKEAATPRGEAVMAAAGPLVSLGIGVVCWAAATFAPGPEQLRAVLLFLGFANVTLTLFNLLPGLPLDGGRVLHAFLWWRWRDRMRATRGAALAGQIVGAVFLALGVLQILGGAPLGGLWLAAIGWVIVQGSRASAAQEVLSGELAGATAARLMTAPAVWLRPFVTLNAAAEHGFRDFDTRCLPVEPEEEGQVFDGLVCVGDLNAAPRPVWDVRRVREAMVPAEDIPVVAPGTPVPEVLRLMQTRHADRVAVIAGGRLLGFVDPAAIERYLVFRETRRRRAAHRLTAA